MSDEPPFQCSHLDTAIETACRRFLLGVVDPDGGGIACAISWPGLRAPSLWSSRTCVAYYDDDGSAVVPSFIARLGDDGPVRVRIALLTFAGVKPVRETVTLTPMHILAWRAWFGRRVPAAGRR